MVNKIHTTMKGWEESKNVVVIKGSGEKAFCAGGDVKSLILALNKPEGKITGDMFFRNEYRYIIYLLSGGQNFERQKCRIADIQ